MGQPLLFPCAHGVSFGSTPLDVADDGQRRKAAVLSVHEGPVTRGNNPSETRRHEGLSAMITSREIRLKSRLVGMPSADNFELVTVPVPRPGPGEVQVQNLWMTVDPYMRGRMADRAIYTPSFRPGEELPGAVGEIAASNSTMYGWRPNFQVGETLQGGAIGEVAASDDPRFKPGDLVSSWFGWRGRLNGPARRLQKLDTVALLPQGFLGAARMPGLTALAR